MAFLLHDTSRSADEASSPDTVLAVHPYHLPLNGIGLIIQIERKIVNLNARKNSVKEKKKQAPITECLQKKIKIT